MDAGTKEKLALGGVVLGALVAAASFTKKGRRMRFRARGFYRLARAAYRRRRRRFPRRRFFRRRFAR